MSKSVLVTGGCGFIGSNFLNYMVQKYPEWTFVNLDKLDYCAREKNVVVRDNVNYHFVKGDICDGYVILKILNEFNIDIVVNFAAYSHVDNSFDNSVKFSSNNIVGTHQLLESCRIWGKLERFVHVSTDEVYGEIEEGEFRETALLMPTNPYAASKAGAEMIVQSYIKSYNFPAIITRGNNVYGPFQYPEKLIPKFILSALNQQSLTIHGEGKSIRNFIHVYDVVRAFEIIILDGVIGEIYNIGTKDEYTVLDIFMMVQNYFKRVHSVERVHVEDRAFNDMRYSINSDKLINLGWKATVSMEEGFEQTCKWYVKNSQHFI